MTGLVFVAYETLEAIQDLAPGWRELHARSVYPSLYNSPDFVIACVMHFRDEDMRPWVLAVKDAERLVAVFPFQVSSLEYYGAKLKVIQYNAPWESDKPYPVIAQGFEAVVWSEFGEYLRTSGESWHQLDLMEWREELPGKKALLSNFASPMYWSRMRPHRKSPVLSLRVPWEDRWNTHRKMRKKVSRMRRAFGDDLRFEVFDGREKRAELLDAYMSIESRGWKAGEIGIGRGDDATAFYRDLFGRLANRDSLRFGVLSVGDRPISIEIAYIEGKEVYFSHGTFDEEYAKYSPGMVSTCLFLEHFHRTEYDRGDFLAGYAAYIVPWVDKLVDSKQVSIYRITPTVLYVFLARALRRILRRRAPEAGRGAATL